MDRENWIEFLNIITMDDENIEKFKKLYGEGERIGGNTFPETLLSFSMVIPETSRNDADSDWADKTNQNVWFWREMRFPEDNPEPEEFNGVKIAPDQHPVSEMIGKALEQWRTDNWGTPSDVLYGGDEEAFYGENDGPCIRTLDVLFKGKFPFYTYGRPPFKVYEKMAADGLVFEIRWWCDQAYDEWFTGKGQVEKGRFQYHVGPMTGDENLQMQLVAHDFLDCSEEDTDNQKRIVVKNREHLDQLLKELQRYVKTNLYMQGKFSLINKVSGNTIILNKVLDLNFLDVTNVTDLSNLSEYLDVSPCPDNGWFCKIKLDTSKWKK